MMKLLERDKTGLLVIDVQEKLMPVIGHSRRVTDNIVKLLHLSKCFMLPHILTEHYPRWLGSTVPEVKEQFSEEPVTKLHFNCCEVDAFNDRLTSEDIDQVILTGVESHICIFQTCFSLLEKGFQVHVPQDAVGSRTDENRRVGLELMNRAGAVITSTESVIYQLLKKAGTKEFRTMVKMMK